MSTHPKFSFWLHASRLGHHLPNGRRLFSQLEFALQRGTTGLVGRNGIGKSVLARLLAGEWLPSEGVIERQGRIAYAAQCLQPGEGSVAQLLGCAGQLAALQRIKAGSCDPDDFEQIGDGWDLEARLERWLDTLGLDYLAPQTPLATLSGGELARLSLVAALLRNPDHLILDEPSNHLDRAGRRLLSGFITSWQDGLLLISHDRELLEQVDEIYCLDGHGLQRYSGNYSAYAAARKQKEQSLQKQIAHGKALLVREQQEQSTLLARQQKRLQRGRRERREANQAKVLLDRQKERSDHGSARLADNQAARVQRCAESLRALQAEQEVTSEIRLALPTMAAMPRRVAELDTVRFGFDHELFNGLSVQIAAGERIALRGRNGSGKSTLLRLLTGELQAQAGTVRLNVACALIDQHTSLLDAAHTPLENFRTLSPGLVEREYRHRLVRLRLDAARVATPVAALSGGERLMCALACVLLGGEAKPLLLLDEPTNNLDLEAAVALESALQGYQGTLLVVSHDERFLEALGITRDIVL